VHATNLKKLLQIESSKEAIQKAIEEEIDNLMAPGVMEANYHQPHRPYTQKRYNQSMAVSQREERFKWNISKG
jgi:hypothetical protein